MSKKTTSKKTKSNYKESYSVSLDSKLVGVFEELTHNRSKAAQDGLLREVLIHVRHLSVKRRKAIEKRIAHLLK